MHHLLRAVRSRPARWVFGLTCVAAACWAIIAEAPAIAAALGRLDAQVLVLASLFTAGNLLMTCFMWRALLTDLGHRIPIVPAARIFFVSQLGKYLPGSLWPVLVQAELGADYGVPRRRTVLAGAATLLVSVVSSAIVVLATAPVLSTLPGLPQVSPERVAVVAVILVLAVLAVLHPALLGRLADLGLAAAGRGPMERRLTLRGTSTSTGWALLSWLLAGAQVWTLAVPLGAPVDARTAAICLGGYALAWAVGAAVIIAPAGVGAREVVLAAVLSAVLPGRAEALVVVLVSRVLFTAADLAAAGLGIAAARSSRSRT